MARKKPQHQSTAMKINTDLESRSSRSGTIASAVPFTAIVPCLHTHAMDIAGQKSYASLCTCREVE